MIQVDDLSIRFQYGEELRTVIRNLSFRVATGEILGVVGESGCGKSIINFALMGLLPSNAIVSAKRMSVGRHELLTFSERQWQGYRGSQVAMIFQDPMSALNPCLSIESQMLEVICKVTKTTVHEAKKSAIAILGEVGIPSPEKRIRNYPHQFSGGMAQRVMIAMALASKPKVLIADEPTTALDVVMQKQILDLLITLRELHGMTIILVSHDIGVIKRYSENIQVMYSGEIVESGRTDEVIFEPRHPYTQSLLRSLPSAYSQEPKTLLRTIPGSVIPITNELKGCRFKERCDQFTSICDIAPALKTPLIGNERSVKCHL